MMSKEFWNNRYAEKEFAYGIEPNQFLEQTLRSIPVGNVLFVAEGEGRNALYAAKLGWKVDAFDQSEEGKNKALLLAEEHSVKLNYAVADLMEIKYEPNSFDVVALIFAHFSPVDKKQYNQAITKYVKQGGYIIFEAFSKTHLQYNSTNPQAGGPSNSDMLFSVQEIVEYFPNFEILTLEEKVYHLKEGAYHKGEGSVIRFLGKKKLDENN
jgi:2-polyprenyl-3-methyl-5-hydroxy-6-metoxy-1,4-benzoquinol methylase